MCPGSEMIYLSETVSYRGCEIIVGPLNLKLDVEFVDLQSQLERNLGDIREIRGSLTIHR